MKRVLNWIIIIPNLPFILALAIYILINILKHTTIVELELADRSKLFNKELQEHIEQIWPRHLRLAIAILFYLSIAQSIIF